MIEVREETLGKVHTILEGVEHAKDKVLSPAFGRALQAGKTEAKRQAVKTYHIKSGDYNKNSYIKYKGVEHGEDEIVGSILFAGRPIPLIKYKTTPTTPQKDAIPKAAVLKENAPVKFNKRNDVFVQQMGTGHIGIFKREEIGNIKQLYGPSTPRMTENEAVMQKIEEKVHEVLNRRIEHEIERLLNGEG